MNRKKQLLALILTFVFVFTSVPGMSLFGAEYDFAENYNLWNSDKKPTDIFESGDEIMDSILSDGTVLEIYYCKDYFEDSPFWKVEVSGGEPHIILSASEAGIEVPNGKRFVNWRYRDIYGSGNLNTKLVLVADFIDIHTVTYDFDNIEVTGEQPDNVTTGQAISLNLEAKLGYKLPNQAQVESVKVEPADKAIMEYTFNPNDGTAVLEVSNITADVRITVIAEKIPDARPRPSGGGAYTSTSYTIKALAKEGGTITPHGNTSVKSGRDQSFKIKPDEWHTLSGLLIDDKEVELDTLETPDIYTFKNVKANHTIEAVFTKKYKELAKAIVTFKIGESRYLVNEKEFPMDAASYIQDPGHTMIPVRYVLEAFDIGGGDISYEDKIIIIKMHGKIIGLTIGSDEAIINGISKKLRTKVVVEDGRTYAPIGEIVRLLDIQKSWDHEAKIATFINQ